MALRERWSELGRVPKAAVAVAGFAVVLAVLLDMFVLGLSAEAVTPPTSFSLAEHPNGTATVTYEEGPPIQPNSLVVEVGNRSTTWRDDDGNVTVGDTVTVEAHQGETITLVYTGGDGKSLLQTIEVGEATAVGSLPHVEWTPSVTSA